MNDRFTLRYADISRFRSELMGLAMLMILLFHVYVPRQDAFFGLHRLGNIGVDMFFLFSGIGLWFSWEKTPSLRHFYARRYLRVYPSWLVVACLYYIPLYNGDVINLIGNIGLNWNFWRKDELTFWYVPAIMMLYTFAPFYMMLIRRHSAYRWLPVLAIMWCVAVQWVVPIHTAVGHIEIFWSRVPIFFIGINLGKYVMERRTLSGDAMPMVVLFFVAAFALCLYLEQERHGKFPLFIERMIYIPLTLSAVLLLAKLLCGAPRWLLSALRFVGLVSLEFYLLHVQFVLLHIQPLGLGYWPTALLTLVITLPLAWLLNKIITLTLKALKIN